MYPNILYTASHSLKKKRKRREKSRKNRYEVWSCEQGSLMLGRKRNKINTHEQQQQRHVSFLRASSFRLRGLVRFYLLFITSALTVSLHY